MSDDKSNADTSQASVDLDTERATAISELMKWLDDNATHSIEDFNKEAKCLDDGEREEMLDLLLAAERVSMDDRFDKDPEVWQVTESATPTRANTASSCAVTDASDEPPETRSGRRPTSPKVTFFKERGRVPSGLSLMESVAEDDEGLDADEDETKRSEAHDKDTQEAVAKKHQARIESAQRGNTI